MSRFYIETPFDNYLIFQIDKKINEIYFAPKREGLGLSGELRKLVLSVFEQCNFSFFDYSLLNVGSLSEKQLKLHNFLISTECGETLYYSEVAEKLFGSRKYARGVARLLSANRFAFFVPCHRVLAKNGIGGYSAYQGVELKRKILQWEGAAF